jgi:prepilin-type N-terminal cleavage/methylation domain-containing protein
VKRQSFSSRRARRGGYTAIEVLISLTVFAIGAAGVIAMQRAAVQGNLDARRLDTANSITRAWIERLRRDAMKWTQPSNISQATVLNGARDTGSWALPTGCATPFDGGCASFDQFGHDLDIATYSANAVFCANIKVDTVARDPATTDPTVLRVAVRVYWPRGLGTAASGGAGSGFCSSGGLTDTSAGPDAPNAGQIYHFVQAVTLLSSSQVPQ